MIELGARVKIAGARFGSEEGTVRYVGNTTVFVEWDLGYEMAYRPDELEVLR
ncbi:hypothetical protein SEA_PUPPER_4 [Gordonia phage Pupper]|uniref:Uncharacterized protein n=1 Tax=Gordonia phage Pupper TaxID=2571249 RepID=A0A4Y6EM58_9CAUD|nr:hypothetical protein KHQ83_gp004 [Gordonia phage Pupper]QDF18491.1 hypothetical protein SEA_PUPPER_4 [Gordonia phage Pupper]QDF18724.1 hypothetical protein SEA_SCENTAE_4 [Gordonia phage SCentae]